MTPVPFLSNPVQPFGKRGALSSDALHRGHGVLAPQQPRGFLLFRLHIRRDSALIPLGRG
jgi:hypothetical protein